MRYVNSITVEESVKVDCAIIQIESALSVIRDKMNETEDPDKIVRCMRNMLPNIENGVKDVKTVFSRD